MAQNLEDDVSKEWMQTALKFGAPTALLAFLVFWLTGDFNVRLRATENQHSNMLGAMQTMIDNQGRTYEATERILFVTRVACANEAKTAEARRQCLSDR